MIHITCTLQSTAAKTETERQTASGTVNSTANSTDWTVCFGSHACDLLVVPKRVASNGQKPRAPLLRAGAVVGVPPGLREGRERLCGPAVEVHLCGNRMKEHCQIRRTAIGKEGGGGLEGRTGTGEEFCAACHVSAAVYVFIHSPSVYMQVSHGTPSLYSREYLLSL